MVDVPPSRSGLLLLRVWLEPPAIEGEAAVVCALITSHADVLAPDELSWAAEGTDEVTAIVRRWLEDFSCAGRR